MRVEILTQDINFHCRPVLVLKTPAWSFCISLSPSRGSPNNSRWSVLEVRQPSHLEMFVMWRHLQFFCSPFPRTVCSATCWENSTEHLRKYEMTQSCIFCPHDLEPFSTLREWIDGTKWLNRPTSAVTGHFHFLCLCFAITLNQRLTHLIQVKPCYHLCL